MQVFGDGMLTSRTATLTFVTKFARVGRHLQQKTCIAAVHGLIHSNRYVYCKIIAQSVGISISTAHEPQTIVAGLGYSKVCA